MIYILQHPDPKFSGFAHGVEFQNGIGSTSSEMDRDFLLALHKAEPGKKAPPQCEDITAEYLAKEKKINALAKAREAKEKKKDEGKKSEAKAEKEEEAETEEEK